ncbi:hypothetical protein ACN42_g3333 [Penicillium freii]|uniref:Uncharacterized protein n=1 Tax=Penicillium freii TaxID=48697 RepID=A0A101MNG8_PENFR|nr:hypothetical protein ACN42_g3333 [Penicillium freii]
MRTPYLTHPHSNSSLKSLSKSINHLHSHNFNNLNSNSFFKLKMMHTEKRGKVEKEQTRQTALAPGLFRIA